MLPAGRRATQRNQGLDCPTGAAGAHGPLTCGGCSADRSNRGSRTGWSSSGTPGDGGAGQPVSAAHGETTRHACGCAGVRSAGRCGGSAGRSGPRAIRYRRRDGDTPQSAGLVFLGDGHDVCSSCRSPSPQSKCQPRTGLVRMRGIITGGPYPLKASRSRSRRSGGKRSASSRRSRSLPDAPRSCSCSR